MADPRTVVLQLTDELGNPYDPALADALPSSFHGTLSVTTTSQSFAMASIAVPQGTRRAFISVEGAESKALRFWTDGSDPTPTEGHRLVSGDELWITHPTDITNFRCILTDALAGTLTLQISFY